MDRNNLKYFSSVAASVFDKVIEDYEINSYDEFVDRTIEAVNRCLMEVDRNVIWSDVASDPEYTTMRRFFGVLPTYQDHALYLLWVLQKVYSSRGSDPKFLYYALVDRDTFNYLVNFMDRTRVSFYHKELFDDLMRKTGMDTPYSRAISNYFHDQNFSNYINFYINPEIADKNITVDVVNEETGDFETVNTKFALWMMEKFPNTVEDVKEMYVIPSLINREWLDDKIVDKVGYENYDPNVIMGYLGEALDDDLGGDFLGSRITKQKESSIQVFVNLFKANQEKFSKEMKEEMFKNIFYAPGNNAVLFNGLRSCCFGDDIDFDKGYFEVLAIDSNNLPLIELLGVTEEHRKTYGEDTIEVEDLRRILELPAPSPDNRGKFPILPSVPVPNPRYVEQEESIDEKFMRYMQEMEEENKRKREEAAAKAKEEEEIRIARETAYAEATANAERMRELEEEAKKLEEAAEDIFSVNPTEAIVSTNPSINEQILNEKVDPYAAEEVPVPIRSAEEIEEINNRIKSLNIEIKKNQREMARVRGNEEAVRVGKAPFITEIKRLEEELAQAKQDLENSFEKKASRVVEVQPSLETLPTGEEVLENIPETAVNEIPPEIILQENFVDIPEPLTSEVPPEPANSIVIPNIIEIVNAIVNTSTEEPQLSTENLPEIVEQWKNTVKFGNKYLGKEQTVTQTVEDVVVNIIVPNLSDNPEVEEVINQAVNDTLDDLALVADHLPPDESEKFLKRLSELQKQSAKATTAEEQLEVIVEATNFEQKENVSEIISNDPELSAKFEPIPPEYQPEVLPESENVVATEEEISFLSPEVAVDSRVLHPSPKYNLQDIEDTKERIADIQEKISQKIVKRDSYPKGSDAREIANRQISSLKIELQRAKEDLEIVKKDFLNLENENIDQKLEDAKEKLNSLINEAENLDEPSQRLREEIREAAADVSILTEKAQTARREEAPGVEFPGPSSVPKNFAPQGFIIQNFKSMVGKPSTPKKKFPELDLLYTIVNTIQTNKGDAEVEKENLHKNLTYYGKETPEYKETKKAISTINNVIKGYRNQLNGLIKQISELGGDTAGLSESLYSGEEPAIKVRDRPTFEPEDRRNFYVKLINETKDDINRNKTLLLLLAQEGNDITEEEDEILKLQKTMYDFISSYDMMDPKIKTASLEEMQKHINEKVKDMNVLDKENIEVAKRIKRIVSLLENNEKRLLELYEALGENDEYIGGGLTEFARKLLAPRSFYELESRSPEIIPSSDIEKENNSFPTPSDEDFFEIDEDIAFYTPENPPDLEASSEIDNQNDEIPNDLFSSAPLFSPPEVFSSTEEVPRSVSPLKKSPLNVTFSNKSQRSFANGTPPIEVETDFREDKLPTPQKIPSPPNVMEDLGQFSGESQEEPEEGSSGELPQEASSSIPEESQEASSSIPEEPSGKKRKRLNPAVRKGKGYKRKDPNIQRSTYSNI